MNDPNARRGYLDRSSSPGAWERPARRSILSPRMIWAIFLVYIVWSLL